MPSSTCAILLVLYATAFTALLGPPFASRLALASPVPMPLPWMAADYSPNNLAANQFAKSGAHKTITPKTEHAVSRNGSAHSRPQRATPSAVETGPTVNSSEYHRELNARQFDYLGLLGYCTQAKSGAESFRNLASNPPANGNDPEFQRNCSDQLSDFYGNLLNAQTILRELAADKGQANYDPSNELETLLKDLVNYTKDILDILYTLLAECPFLDGILRPFMYEIKCILDEILDFLENLTDAIINDIVPI